MRAVYLNIYFLAYIGAFFLSYAVIIWLDFGAHLTPFEVARSIFASVFYGGWIVVFLGVFTLIPFWGFSYMAETKRWQVFFLIAGILLLLFPIAHEIYFSTKIEHVIAQFGVLLTAGFLSWALVRIRSKEPPADR